MTDQIQLLAPTYMIVDGQPQIVEAGSILNVPSASAFRGTSVTLTQNVTTPLPVPATPTKISGRSR